MIYPPDLIARINRELKTVLRELQNLSLTIVCEFAPSLKVERAREYALHGVGRRVRTIRRCLENIFFIFPVERTALLSNDERCDVEINLHAFVINVYGLQDNLAWVYVMEKNMISKIKNGRIGVSLFKKSTQEYLPTSLCEYLRSETMTNWHKDYSQDYRDALAHRIPLYIPPFTVTAEEQARWQDLDSQVVEAMKERDPDRMEALSAEKNAIGTISAMYLHAISDSEHSRPVFLHPQVVCDALTAIELIKQVRQHLP